MKIVKNLFNQYRRHFEPSGKLARLKPLFEATETFFFFPAIATRKDAHVRDSLDLKRFMSFVILALMPPFIFSLYNTGYQAFVAAGVAPGIFASFAKGMWIVMPMVVVSYAVGFFWEVLFAAVRGHNISEGFLVTGLLFPMTLPPTIPLWQVAVGISFGVVIGKEIFGGTGRNILNPALTARAFLFFAYPVKMSGDAVWTAVAHTGETPVDAVTGATALSISAIATSGDQLAGLFEKADFTFLRLFVGNIAGSIGETSALMCLVGAFVLCMTGIASYRIMIGGVVGLLAVTVPGYLVHHYYDNSMALAFSVNPFLHLVMGGFAFGIVYMATDPVTAPGMDKSRWIYGFAIGAFTALIRAFNPAYAEGMMLAILFMNLFAPLLDHFEIKTRLKQRIPNV